MYLQNSLRLDTMFSVRLSKILFTSCINVSLGNGYSYCCYYYIVCVRACVHLRACLKYLCSDGRCARAYNGSDEDLS